MPRRRPHGHGDPNPTRFENAVPRAIRDGNIDELRVQVERAERNGLLTDAIMKSALRAACESDNVGALRILLERANAYHINDGNARTKETLLMTVKSKETAQLLLENSAEINAVDSSGRSALMHAASKDIADVLVRAGADMETKHKQARSTLMHMLMQERSTTADARTDIAHYLIRRNADLEAVDSQGRTLLMTAVWRNHVSIVRTLLSRTPDINATDLRGRNLLHHLCEDRERARRMTKALSDIDKAMVDLIVGSRLQINAQDAFEGKTPLHRAIESNNIYLVRALLSKPQTRTDVLDFRSKSPLHIAAANAHHDILQELLDRGASVQTESDGGWTPLHSAVAGQGKARLRVVTMLLDKGASATARLRNGKSPLHLACEAGELEVVKLLLDEQNVDIMSRDNEGNTPLISAARLGHTHVVKHLTPLNYATARSEDAVKASKGFLATILDFSPERKHGNRRKDKRVYDLLYENYPISPNVPDDTSSTDNTSPHRFRWIHFPSNNITWCQELLLKRFAEQDGADAESFKVLERSFNYQHRGTRLHAHYMRPMCQIVPQTHLHEDCESSDLDSATDEEEAVESIAETLSPPLDRERSRSSTARSNRNLPRRRRARRSSDTTLQASEAEQSLGNLSLAVPPSPSRAPQDRGSNNNLFLFGPYLHYETNGARKEMQRTINLARSRKVGIAQPEAKNQLATPGSTKYENDCAEADQTLINAHVDSVSCSMNARRTLDQYYYRTIDTSMYRDHDQVVHRYQRKHLPEGEKTDGIRILMVDQLWMWIVGKDLIVTSFPRRWKQPRNDAHNILETIISDINLPGRAPVSSVHELALVIASRCFGPFDRRNISEGEMLFLDMFESSVGDAMDRETELFRTFKNASSRWLKPLTSPGNMSYTDQHPVRAPKLDKDQPQDAKQQSDSSDPKPTLVRTLLDIGQETRLMREIKDIRDELNMLRMIFEEQQKLLLGLRKALLEMIKRDGASKRVERNIHRIYADAIPDIVHPLRDIHRMDTQAERIYNSVRDLLDLKQNHAMSMQAADTAHQGRTLMVFTVATVVFLPLSFLTAFFTLDIEDFPHSPDGNQELPLSFVAKYIFGIGTPVALLGVVLALAWERIGQYAGRGRQRVRHLWHSVRHEAQATEHEDPDDTGVVRVHTFQSDMTGRYSVELAQLGHRHVAFADVESGRG